MATHAHQMEGSDQLEVRTRFGTLAVDSDNILTFPQGLPGLSGLDRFVLLHDADNSSIFYLQSIEDPLVRLPLTSPHWFNVDYQITLSDEESALLDAENPEDIAVLVTLKDDEAGPSGISANFNGPIIVNLNTRTGLQKTLHNTQSSMTILAQ